MRMDIRTRRFIGFCVSVLAYSHIAVAQDSPRIVLSAPADPALAERGIVTLTISNPTDERIAIVSFETPFATENDHLGNVQFQVSDSSNHDLPYQGRNVNFGPPETSSFLVLQPHETRRKNVDIAREYSISAGGPYKVTYVKTLRILRSSAIRRIESIRPGDDVPLKPVRSNTLTIWINDSLNHGDKDRSSAIDVDAMGTITGDRTVSTSKHSMCRKLYRGPPLPLPEASPEPSRLPYRQ